MSRNKNKKLNLSDKRPLTAVGKVGLGINYLMLFLWCVIILWPLMQMLISAFDGSQVKYISLNSDFKFSLKHFMYLFTETKYLKWVFNTLFVAFLNVFITILFVSFTGFVYSRYRFKGRKPSLMAIMLIQSIPSFVGITAYFTLHSIISHVNPYFTRQMMLVLIYSAGGIAGNTFILKGYLDSISTELDDAARIDGCSSMKVYRLIIMPIAKPMLSIIALWSFITPFVDYLLPKVLLTNIDSYTLAAGLNTLIIDQRNLNEPAFAAGGLLIAVPIVILFISFQKQLVSGLARGAVKG